jgi:hypothetical protein
MHRRRTGSRIVIRSPKAFEEIAGPGEEGGAVPMSSLRE